MIFVERFSYFFVFGKPSLSFAFSFFIRAPTKPVPLLNYSRDWLGQINIDNLKKPHSHDNACQFRPKRQRTANSTPDDLVLAVQFGKTIGLLPFINTWSSTNSNATCVILINNETQSNMKDEKITIKDARKRGVHIISVGAFYPPKGKDRGLFIVPALEFLDRYGRYFNRVIIADCNDNVFQGDPFQEDFHWDGLGFNFELFHIGDQLVGQMWIIYLEAWIPIYNIRSEMVNTGFLSGTADRVSIFSNLLLYVWDTPNFPSHLHDQGLANYLIMGSFLRDAGVEYQTRTRGMLGNYRGYFETEEVFPNYTNRYSDEDSIIIHYYMCDRDSFNEILKICSLRPDYPKKYTYCRMEYIPL